MPRYTSRRPVPRAFDHDTPLPGYFGMTWNQVRELIRSPLLDLRPLIEAENAAFLADLARNPPPDMAG